MKKEDYLNKKKLLTEKRAEISERMVRELCEYVERKSKLVDKFEQIEDSTEKDVEIFKARCSLIKLLVSVSQHRKEAAILRNKAEDLLLDAKYEEGQ